MLTTTLAEIHALRPYPEGLRRSLYDLRRIYKYKAGTPIPVSSILDIKDLYVALWIVDQLHPAVARLLAIGFVTPMLRFMDDPRSREAVKVAHLYAHGEATDAELGEAKDAAFAAAKVAYASYALCFKEYYCYYADALPDIRRARFATVRAKSLAAAAANTAAWVATPTDGTYECLRYATWTAHVPHVPTEQKRLMRYLCDNWEENR